MSRKRDEDDVIFDEVAELVDLMSRGNMAGLQDFMQRYQENHQDLTHVQMMGLADLPVEERIIKQQEMLRKMFEKMDGNEADPSMVSDLLASLEIHYDDLKTARMNRRARDVLMVMLEYEHESFVDDLIPKILELDAWIEDDDNASKIYKKYGGHDLETDLLMGLVFYKTGALDKAESLLKKFMTYPEFVEVAPYLSDIDEFYEAYDDYNSEDFMDDEYDYDDDDYDEDDYDEEDDDDFDLADHDDFMSFDDEDDEYTFYDLWDQYTDLFTENEAFFEWVGRHL